MSVGKLFGRSWNITVGDTELNDFATEFSVKKTLKPEPNVAELRIYNLSDATRRKLTQPKKVKIRIEAGYGDSLSMLYLGDVRAIMPGEIVGADRVTDLTSADSEKAIQGTRLRVPIGAKMDTGDALRTIISALGVKDGNAAAVAQALRTKGKTVFARGTVLNGNTARILTDFCRAAGLEWSIQDGAIQLLDLGGHLETNPFVLSADSGLIGSPKLSTEGFVTAECLMIPGLRPGVRVVVESFSVKGVFRITQAEYVGQTHGSDWKIKILGERSPRKVPPYYDWRAY